MDLKELTFSLCYATTFSSEESVLDIAVRELEPLGVVEKTSMGSIIAHIKGKSDETIMLEAHIDEISMIVTNIDDKGFLHVDKCGGVDSRVLMGAEVTVWGKTPLYGVFCSVPPHLSKNGESDTVPSITDLAIDIGLSSEKAKEFISLGSRVTFKTYAKSLQNGFITGKSLDDRAGCAAIINAVKLIVKKGIPDYNITVLLAEQEEIGSGGAKTGCYQCTPVEAIAVDVSFGEDPLSDKNKCGVLGAGPMLGISPTLDAGLTNKLKETALKNNISIQFEVMGGKTSTDSDYIAVTKTGVKCALLSIPLRNMHTAVEMAKLSDIEDVSRLIAAYVLEKGVL